MSHQITVTVPEALYRQLAAEAKRRECSLEAVVVERLTLRPLDLRKNNAELIATMQDFSIEELWAVVEQHLTENEFTRYAELTCQHKTGSLTTFEEAEMSHLVELLDRYTLLRAEALLLLREQGEDIEIASGRVLMAKRV